MITSTLDSAVAIARALGHPARLRTVAMLATGELCVCQITAVLELASSTVSAHLKELRLAGITEERKQGRWVYIRLSESSSVLAWIETSLEAVAGDPQVTADLDLVSELRRVPVEDLCRSGFDVAAALSGHHTDVRSPERVSEET